MFGYITIAPAGLEKSRQERYRAMYCGLCHTLRERFGSFGQLTLSYDATFLYLLLSSLYEPEELSKTERCLPHPLRTHPYIQNAMAAYCCDMNIALAYHKCRDNWQDDRNMLAHAEASLLKKGYEHVVRRYPEKCLAIEHCLSELSLLEKKQTGTLDDVVNLSAKMLGIVFRWQEDHWADSLERIGQCLGRFIYLMDAYEDLPSDLRRKRFNPLKTYQENDDYETFIKENLTMLIGECTDVFEVLPLVQDVDILRNILYAGCWTRYGQLQQKQKKRSSSENVYKSYTHKEDGA